jgi:hypothetical protein
MLTLHVYLYSNNLFPFETKVSSIYTNKYYIYDREHCNEHINVLNRLYIVTSYLLKLAMHFMLYCHLCLCLLMTPFPSVLYVIMYWEKYIPIWHVDGCFRRILTCRTLLRTTILSPLHFPSYSFSHTLLRLCHYNTFYISEHLSPLCAPSEE